MEKLNVSGWRNYLWPKTLTDFDYKMLKFLNLKSFHLRIFKYISCFVITEINTIFMPLPNVIVDLPRGILKCVMFKFGSGCPHPDVRFYLYTP